MTRHYWGVLLLFLFSCNHVETGSTLHQSDVDYIRRLNLLDPGETIHQFYSELSYKKAGNFFTDKRIGMYWIDDRQKEKNKIAFAFYPDIRSVDTIYNPGASYCPYMLVTRLDSSQFKVCVDGKREEIRAFFEEGIKLWLENRGIQHSNNR